MRLFPPSMNVWRENENELYDLADGPRAPRVRRPTTEWDDPYDIIDVRASVALMPRWPPPSRRPGLWSIPEIAKMRRAGVPFSKIRGLVGYSIGSLREWLSNAGFDEWGWRLEMRRHCVSCQRDYSPAALRQRSERATWAAWPSFACSNGCARQLGVPNPQG